MQSIVHHPLAYRVVGSLELTGFGIAVLLAFWLAQTICVVELSRRRQVAAAEAMPDVTIAAVIGGLLGAKIYYAILTGNPLDLFHRAGFVFWGGLIGGIVVTAIVIRMKKIPFARISDVAGIGVAAAYAVGRTGCWAVGDDYGRRRRSPTWSSSSA
jgi:phosphatidylglycerol:prolipoprotein diacylglycerol transferase